mmetsp:Transcript_71005/g.185097  ORF Transcript_71005/g.185097 Transcript_71005/m.185097 type:complete len:341 (+) Transcript_71005:155-1177(+)
MELPAQPRPRRRRRGDSTARRVFGMCRPVGGAPAATAARLRIIIMLAGRRAAGQGLRARQSRPRGRRGRQSRGTASAVVGGPEAPPLDEVTRQAAALRPSRGAHARLLQGSLILAAPPPLELAARGAPQLGRRPLGVEVPLVEERGVAPVQPLVEARKAGEEGLQVLVGEAQLLRGLVEGVDRHSSVQLVPKSPHEAGRPPAPRPREHRERRQQPEGVWVPAPEGEHARLLGVVAQIHLNDPFRTRHARIGQLLASTMEVVPAEDHVFVAVDAAPREDGVTPVATNHSAVERLLDSVVRLTLEIGWALPLVQECQLVPRHGVLVHVVRIAAIQQPENRLR